MMKTCSSYNQQSSLQNLRQILVGYLKMKDIYQHKLYKLQQRINHLFRGLSLFMEEGDDLGK